MPIDVAADLKPPDGKAATLLANLDIFYKLGTIEAPTDEAWQKRREELNI